MQTFMKPCSVFARGGGVGGWGGGGGCLILRLLGGWQVFGIIFSQPAQWWTGLELLGVNLNQDRCSPILSLLYPHFLYPSLRASVSPWFRDVSKRYVFKFSRFISQSTCNVSKFSLT
jgi:hypothetical protein